jgi:hypothetical protein
VARVAHEDGGLDLLLCRSGNGDRRARETLVGVATAAVGVVEDLTTLRSHAVSFYSLRKTSRAHLRVTDEHQERVRALLVERVDLARDGLHALDDRVGVADVAAGGLATAGGVVDRLGRRAGVRADDRVDDRACGTVPRRDGRLACAKDVDLWAARALLDRVCSSEGGAEEEKRGGAESHHGRSGCGVVEVARQDMVRQACLYTARARYSGLIPGLVDERDVQRVRATCRFPSYNVPEFNSQIQPRL